MRKINDDFQTPEWVCSYMTSLIPSGVKSILEPTPGMGNLVRSMNGYSVTAPEDFWKLEKDRWDCIVMNPPFSPMAIGYKILYACMDLSDRIIALMPWLTIINSEKRTEDISNFGLRSITHLPRRAFSGSRVQTCILDMEYGYKGNIELRFL